MGTATSKSAENNNIIDKNYKDDKKPYKFFSYGNKKENEKKDCNNVINNYLGDRNDYSCNSLSYY